MIVSILGMSDNDTHDDVDHHHHHHHHHHHSLMFKGDVSDPRKLIVVEFRIVYAPEEKMVDIVHDLSTPEGR